MGLSRYCWRPWLIRGATVERVTGQLIGPILGWPAVVGGWTEKAKGMGQRPKPSLFILSGLIFALIWWCKLWEWPVFH